MAKNFQIDLLASQSSPNLDTFLDEMVENID
jgi:hypothetical protein